MNKSSRSKQVLLNSIFGASSLFVSLISTYAVRIAISRFLGAEIYGLNSVMYSLINVLLILELGVSAAIVIFLYKPVAENNLEEIKSIVRFYRNIYRCFCFILAVLGIVLCFGGLNIFIHTTIDIISVRICFILYLLGIIFRYLLGYKKCLLFASQKNRVNAIITSSVEIIFCITEFLVIMVFNNYYLYLLLFILQNICANIACNIYINRHYPYINEKDIKPIGENFKKRLFSIIKPMLIQRITNQICNSSSSIILGIIADVVIVGRYSNYLIIIHAGQTIMNQVSNAFTSSFGNLAASKNDKIKQYSIYRTSRIGMYFLSIIMTIGFCTLADMVISLLFGASYLLSKSEFILVVLYLYVTLIYSVDISIQNAIGLHRLDSNIMVLQSIITIISSFFLGQNLGLNGILIGNIIPFFIFSVLYKAYIIHTVYFEKLAMDIIKIIIKEFLIVIVIISSIMMLKNTLSMFWGSFIVQDITCLFIGLIETIIIFQVGYRRNKYYCTFKAKIIKALPNISL